MQAKQHVKFFRNGRNKAVRIPRAFEFAGDDAMMFRDGDRLIIEPVKPQTLLALLATLSPIEDDFLPFEDGPPDPVSI